MNLTHAVGFTLLHFLWEGALIAVLLAGTLALLRHAGSRARYAASCIALLLMLVSATATFLQLDLSGAPPHHSAAALTNLKPSTASRGIDAASSSATADYLPPLVWAWFGGVIALSIRSLGGWAVAKRWSQRHTWPAEAFWDERFAALARRLSISRPVTLVVSALAQVPAVVGWVRPIVLVPAGVFTGLTAEQIEALLAHELAHVRRHDYLVNLLQTAAETLFFYHPAVWWVSRQIRNERENCCDDLAVETCGNALAYVRALTELEQMRHAAPRLAMAADGGSLTKRVHRLLRLNSNASMTPSGWLAAMGVAVCLVVAGVTAKGLAQRPDDAPAPSQTSAQVPERPSPPKKESGGWLAEIEAAGFRNLDVDQLISLRVHDVDGAYIRQMRAAGLQLTADQLVSFRIHDVTPDFMDKMKQAGLRDLKPDDLVALRIHDVDPAWIRQIQSLGYPDVSVDNIVGLRIYDVTPEFIREAQKRFKSLSVDQVIQLKQFAILE